MLNNASCTQFVDALHTKCSPDAMNFQQNPSASPTQPTSQISTNLNCTVIPKILDIIW